MSESLAKQVATHESWDLFYRMWGEEKSKIGLGRGQTKGAVLNLQGNRKQLRWQDREMNQQGHSSGFHKETSNGETTEKLSHPK